jgi:plastocyanin
MIGLWVGFYFARTRQIPRHRNTQTTMVLGNLSFIAAVMATSFYTYIVEGRTITGTVATLMMVHGFLGLIAELSGIYLILRMRTQLIPQRLRVRNFRLVMRSTLGLWTIVLLIGIGIYYFRYLTPTSVAAEIQMDRFKLTGQDLVTHALETQSALQRGNLPTAKRHAEHVVNLVEGNRGANYGDLDKDGTVEDPGDGTGLLNYLKGFRGGGQQLETLAAELGSWLKEIDKGALTIVEAKTLQDAQSRIEELVSLVRRANMEGVAEIEQRARGLGLGAAPVPADTMGPNMVMVIMKGFQFGPRDVTVKRGDTLVWVNKEAPRHTATADDMGFNSGTMGREDTFSSTFNETGTFPYYCRFHGDKGGVGMAGTVVVR